MSFTRDTARASAQKAVYDILKAVLLYVAWRIVEPWLAERAVAMNVPGAIAWATLMVIVVGSVGVFLFDWWRAGRRGQSVNAAHDELVIHSAKYGVGESSGQYVDVKKAVEDEVRGNELDLYVSNETLHVGNPFKKQRKRLFVTYSLPERIEVAERDQLRIPPLRMKRNLQMDPPHYIAHAEGQSTGPIPVGTNGRIIVDVTDRPEAQLGDVYDPATGVFRKPVGGRLDHMRRLLREAAQLYLHAPRGTEAGVVLLRIFDFLQRGFAHHVRPDFQTYLNSEETKGVPHAPEVISGYLERLAAGLTAADIDERFHLPDNFRQYSVEVWAQHFATTPPAAAPTRPQ